MAETAHHALQDRRYPCGTTKFLPLTLACSASGALRSWVKRCFRWLGGHRRDNAINKVETKNKRARH